MGCSPWGRKGSDRSERLSTHGTRPQCSKNGSRPPLCTAFGTREALGALPERVRRVQPRTPSTRPGRVPFPESAPLLSTASSGRLYTRRRHPRLFGGAPGSPRRLPALTPFEKSLLGAPGLAPLPGAPSSDTPGARAPPRPGEKGCRLWAHPARPLLHLLPLSGVRFDLTSPFSPHPFPALVSVCNSRYSV